MQQQLISIIVPVYNEARNLPLLYHELKRNTKRQPFKFEMLFVDDGSSDNSANVIRKFARRDNRVQLIQLARNFGKEAAMTAGLHTARGDAALILDADMQMPPQLMGKFIKLWRNGAEVVVGVFAKRNMSRLHEWGSNLFYGVMQMISNTDVTPHATDYRLLDRQVIDAFNTMTERNRMTRGLIDWVGFNREYVYFRQAPRRYGNPTYNFKKLVALAINSFTSYSLVPLKLAGYLGIFILLFSAPLGLFLTVDRFVLHDPLHWGINGTTLLAVMILFLVGVMLACLGLMSLYIAHIYDEVTNRPLYVTRHEHQRPVVTKEVEKMAKEVMEA
jgi:polyisoprenyl-phosphate glycosyltransferase